MKRTGILHTLVSNRFNRLCISVATLAAAAAFAFGGLSTVGAQATGTYQCGTYGGGNYDQTDCTDPATGGGTSTGGSTSTGSGSTSSGSSSTGGSSSSSSSTGSSTGTSTGTSTTATTILLNDFSEYTAATGKSLDFKQGAVFYFNLKGEKHTITVKSADASTLIVTIASTPTDVSVPIGQTVSYDVDKDGTPDIAVTYSSFAASTSTATAVYRALSTSTSTSSTSTGSETQNSTGGTTLPATGSTNLWWVWLFPVAIGLGLLVWAILALKRRKAAANGNGTFNGPTF